MKNIVVVGGGFAGLWTAVSAVRRLEEIGENAKITLINKDEFHSIRVRNYEADLSDTMIDLKSVLDPIGVELVLGEVINIDTARKIVEVAVDDTAVSNMPYDKLVLASGSRLVRPELEGIERAFDIDTYAAAIKLKEHLESLPANKSAGAFTAVVVGSGATGVELATELPARLREIAVKAGVTSEKIKVVLADRSAIASGLGEGKQVIERACRELGVELYPDFRLRSITDDGVVLEDGTQIDTATVVWCGGMQADHLTSQIPGERDERGRLIVDENMRVVGVNDVYAAGDTARSLIDGENPSVMSCQHARPMGRYAGTNVVNDLFGSELLPLNIDWYTNIIDLGPWGAVYTQGWDRLVVAEGHEAKRTKSIINKERIYPPRNGDRAAIIESGAPTIQRPPVLVPLSQRGEAA